MSERAGGHKAPILAVAALTGGKSVPAARFRVRQLIKPLARNHVCMREFVAPISMYPPSTKWIRPFWLMASLSARLPSVVASHRYDIVFLQRELISTFRTLEAITATPRVFDVDDAIFLHRGGRFAQKIAQQSDLIICGNDYLAEKFVTWNKNIAIVPTAVDVNKYIPKSCGRDIDKKIIGWIGTSSNFRYLYKIEGSLAKVLKNIPDVVLRIVSDSLPRFSEIDFDRVEFIPWSPEIEIESIQDMTIGIMPLADSEWARGKCSFKMLQYMACGLPVVVSSVGMNAKILALGDIGIGATTDNDWVHALIHLLTDERSRIEMGRCGRRVVEQNFSTEVIASILAGQFRQLT